jgi:hypothetical protein
MYIRLCGGSTCTKECTGFLSINSPGWNWEDTALLIAIPTPSIIARMIPPVGLGEGRGGEGGRGRKRETKGGRGGREGMGQVRRGRERETKGRVEGGREGGERERLLHIFHLEYP